MSTGRAAPALAQSGGGSGCGGGPGLDTAEVTIDEPARNAVLSGKNVAVRGSARASLGQLSRVEITLAGITKVKTASPSSTIDFEATFDVTNVIPGDTSLDVVACGAFSLAGQLARGETEIPVRVQASPGSTTTTVARSTTVVASGGAAAAGATSTTVGATTTTRVGQTTTSSTTATSVAPPGDRQGAAAPAKAEPVRPRASDAPLVLREAQEDQSSRPRLWVGAVVGLSGGLGLFLSASSSRRRRRIPLAAEPLEPLEPTESDLVDVR